MSALPNQVAFHEDPPLLWRHHYATHGNGIWFLAFSHYRMWPPSVDAMPCHSIYFPDNYDESASMVVYFAGEKKLDARFIRALYISFRRRLRGHRVHNGVTIVLISLWILVETSSKWDFRAKPFICSENEYRFRKWNLRRTPASFR